MKKKLYLLRHAKSAKAFHGLEDIDRPLNETGYLEAYKIAEQFAKLDEKPELIITSPAIRAYTTALIFHRELKLPESQLVLSPRLYEIEIKNLYDFVAGLDDTYNSIMIAGHNPSFSQFASEMNPEISHIPTSGLLRFDFEAPNWCKSTYLNANLGLFLVP